MRSLLAILLAALSVQGSPAASGCKHVLKGMLLYLGRRKLPG